MTEPTTTASARLRAEFTAMLGAERQSKWLTAFADVRREHYVPSFYRQDAQNQWEEVSMRRSGLPGGRVLGRRTDYSAQ